MKISHEEYLKRMLREKRLELENVRVNLRIAIAEGDVKKEMLTREIDSIERQLGTE